MKTLPTGHLLRAALAPVALVFILASDAHALRDPENQGRWNRPCKNGPDAEVPGFLVNMGPTGARGILKDRSYVVKHIFRKSPADGVLQLDDEVYGANGKRFSAHTFGPRNPGIDGPMRDLGMAIEDSEGRDGVLSLMVTRSGTNIVVDVQLEALGRFADTFPFNCPKTDILKARANKYLIDNPGGLSSQGRAVATLALLSSDDRRTFTAGRRMALDWNRPYNESTWSWHLGFQGVTLAEYHHLTGDRSVLKTLESTMDLLRLSQWKGPEIRLWNQSHMPNVTQAVIDRHQALYDGGFGHCPYPEVVQRGGGGYGPMQWPTCLAIMTWQLGAQAGIEITHPGVDAGFQFLDNGTTASGHIAYGGEFTLNNGPVDHKQWKSNTRNSFSHKSGLGYLVYMLAPERPDSRKMMRLHLSNIDAAYKDMADGHACAMMGLTWGLAGVCASGDTRLQRKVLDYYKAWLNLARCHGSDSYVILPGRDHADESYYRDNIRNHTTASVAFIYSFSTPKLRVHGAAAANAGAREPGSTSRLPTSPDAALHTFRNVDGTRSIEATFVAFDPPTGIVRVRLKYGGTRDIPFLSLSEESREYVKQQIAGDPDDPTDETDHDHEP